MADRTAKVAVLGLGYAGLPMAVELARSGYAVTGMDIDQDRVLQINEGISPLPDLSSSELVSLVAEKRLCATTEFQRLAKADCVLICVPTPLTPDKNPNLNYVEAAGQSIGAFLHSPMLVILQSTCAPGTTRNVLLPILVQSGLKVGSDFFVAFAPERIDPGNRTYTVRNTPKVIGGVTKLCGDLACRFFAPVVERIEVVSSPEVAEMSKLVENAFRFINISFANELAIICDKMGLSIWEIIQASSSKPFAFMPHYPGPGVGGHCIPVVPFYLQAAAKDHGTASEIIAAAGLINEKMPSYVVMKLEMILAAHGKTLTESRVLALGVSYKADTGDVRESAAIRVLAQLNELGCQLAYYDPYVPAITLGEATMSSVATEDLFHQHFDCAILLTAHADFEYEKLARIVDVVLDTRNRFPEIDGPAIVRL